VDQAASLSYHSPPTPSRWPATVNVTVPSWRRPTSQLPLGFGGFAGRTGSTPQGS
jgi:hypothetical protein